MLRARRHLAKALLAVIAAGATLTACDPKEPPPLPADLYGHAGECRALRDATTGRFLRREGLGYTAVGGYGTSTPFRMQATALGRYLLYGPGRTAPRAEALGLVTPTTALGPRADWEVSVRDGLLAFTNVATGRGLSVGAGGAVVQSRTPEARWQLVPRDGCEEFPDIDPGTEGEPFRGATPDGPVQGFLDAHTHVSAFRFLGGRFHCGRPWSPYGVEDALRDCVDHAAGGVGAVAENLLSSGSPVGTHHTDGWPGFTGWPRTDSLTHEGTYWRWIERAWRGGLRIMVNDLVENVALCEIYPLSAGTSCNEMDSVRLQAADMYALQDYIDAQYKGPGRGFLRIVRTPQEARRVVNEGRLAVVLGVEVSEVLDCGLRDGEPLCDEDQIDARLDELHDLGVRSLFPVHKFDNALAGTTYDEGAVGLLVNLGNKWSTGRWWQPESCAPDADESDNTPANLSADQQLLALLLGDAVAPLLGGDLPAYPVGSLCNPRGLTDLGVHLLEAMAERGMIVETDHMSVRARSEALDVLDELGYGGLISSHSWGDTTSQRRLQAMGGVVAPYAREGYIERWQLARANAPDHEHFGLGFGTDTNGLGAQAHVRQGNDDDPVRYPFRTFDGGTLMHRQVSGTRTFDVNVDGAAHYGLFPDWIEDLRMVAGDEIVEDMAQGAEAYLRMWERATGTAG